MAKDLRGFIALLEDSAPEEIVRVQNPISTKYEISALLTHLEKRKHLPALVFENVDGGDTPVVLNIHASRRLLGLALDTAPENLAERFLERQMNPPPPVEAAAEAATACARGTSTEG